MKYEKKVTKVVKCPKCRQDFLQRRSNQRHCSQVCKKNLRKRPYLVYRKDKCDFCGFIPVDVCQLDVDHIDGNHDNNNESNLQTLCANCHRLKTKLTNKKG